MAEIDGRLDKFVEWHRKLSHQMLPKLVTKDVSKGCGRKGGKAPAKKKKVEPIRERVELTPVVPSLADTQCKNSISNSIEIASSLHTNYYSHPIAASHSQFLNPVGYATPMNPLPSSHSLLPATPFVPWCNSSYNNNNGNQTVQQFVSASTFASPSAECMQKFFIKFIVGNISVCYGCRNRYPKNPKPPDDICLQTEEWRQFTPAGSLLPQTR